MDQTGLDGVCLSAEKKLKLFGRLPRYFVYACMAGCFCSLGMALAYTVGGELYQYEALRGLYKLMMGVTFTLSFTMIVFAGAELFTGNMLVMTMGVLNRKVTGAQALRLLVFCYFSNLLGAAAMGLLVASTGLLASPAGALLVSSAAAKTEIAFFPALTRGVLCNMLVCLGIWCSTKVKSETARLILLVWAVLGFVAPGYEHSIANAGIFTMAAAAAESVAMPGAITLSGVVRNMLPVTLGNILGGGLVGWIYWFAGREK